MPRPGTMNHLNNIPTNHITPSALHHQVLNQNIPPPISTSDSLLNQNSDQHKGEDITSMFKQFFSKAANNKPQTSEAPTGGWNPSWAASGSIGSMWDMPVSKPEMKTEQQILEEQLRLRKEAEDKENREKEQKRQIEEAQQQALKNKEKEIEKAKKLQQELEEKAKAKKEAEEKDKAEQKRKQQLAEQQKKELQEQQQRAKKELEAKAKKEAEEKRLRELEEKRRLKEERKEAELKRKQEAELSIKKKQEVEQEKAKEEAKQRQQLEEEREREKEKERQKAAAEAKKLLQQQQQQQAMANSNKTAPWRPPTETSPTTTSSLSLAEIQKLEREKRAEQLKEQQAQQQALRQQQAAMLKEQELAAANERSAMQLKWANQKPQNSGKVKSLAEIQAEEMAKQQAAERLAAQQRERESPVVQQAPSIWSSAPSLNWSSSAWSANTGFWDEPAAVVNPTQNKVQAKSNGKQTSPQNKSSNKPNAVSNQNSHINLNGGQKINSVASKQDKNTAANNNNNPNNKKKKKDDHKDDFTNWCTKAMSSINGSVDAPTFISFLNEIDSPFEVKDYIRTYLGDSKEAIDFSKQFLEKRSRFRNQQRLASAHIDDMCSPAPAINPGSEFHEGKGKKSKKNKMQKVDSRILGFNVTAAQDRINIGDRDYGDAN